MAKRNSSDGGGRKDSGRRGRPGKDQRNAPRSGGKPSKFTGRKRDSDDNFSSPRKRSFSSDEKPKRKSSFGDKPFSKGDKRADSSAGKRTFSSSGERPKRKSTFGDKPFSKGDKRSDFSPKKSFPPRGKRFGDASENTERKRPSDRKYPSSSKRPFPSDETGKRRAFDNKSGSRTDKRSDYPPKKSSFNRDEKSSRPPGKFSKGKNEKFSGASEKRGEGRFPMDRKGSGSRDSGSKPYRPSSDRAEKSGKFARDDRSEAPRGKTSGKRPRKEKSDSGEAYSAIAPVQTGQIRLNRYIANSGVCSRREADELITMGLISVNGKTITEMGHKVNPDDVVRYEDRVLKAERPVYILLNKPKGFLTTTSDPQERNTVMQLIANAVKERIYPVGRLDRNTTGLLLLTNDGDLADKLMHPSYNVKKIYKVELDRPLTKPDFEKLREGIDLEEGKAIVDDIAIVSEDGKTVGVELHIGWNRVVRRLFEALDYQVVKLDRSVYAGLDKKDLPRGHWRFLRKEEIVRLKHYK